MRDGTPGDDRNRREPPPQAGREPGELRGNLLRQLTNTAGQLQVLQRENESVKRRMDDILRCDARLASMLHQQNRVLWEMSERLGELGRLNQSWFTRWLDGWRQAA